MAMVNATSVPTTHWGNQLSHFDVAVGVIHVVAGLHAILGNGAVFCSFFRQAKERASACLFVQVREWGHSALASAPG